MKDIFDEIKENYDFIGLQNRTYTLARMEKRNSYDDFDANTKYCMEEMKRLGFSQVRRFTHKADGVSSCFDCIMPRAWSRSRTKRSFLEIVEGKVPEYEKVLADSNENPMQACFWMAPTPAKGIKAELVNFDDIGMERLSEAKGKWLLYAPEKGFSLSGGNFNTFAKSGIAGLVLCNLSNLETMPDDLNWYNGLGYCGWYLSKEDANIPAFSIPPRRAITLKAQLKAGRIVVNGVLNSKIYDGETYTVTGIVPGESKEEIALFAHLYEPFVIDDSAGFAHLCELGAQLIRRKVKLKKTLRVVFSMELYGFAAYLKQHGKNIILAANFDGIQHNESYNLIMRRTPFYHASCADWIMEDTLKKRLDDKFTLIPEPANLSDDTFANDPYFGIPTFWMHSPCKGSHHSTGYLFEPNWLASKEILPVFAEIIQKLLCGGPLPDYSTRAEKDLDKALKDILQNKELSSFEKRVRANVEFQRQCNRLASLKTISGIEASTERVAAIYDKAKKTLDKLPKDVLSTAEQKADSWIVKAAGHGYPFSLARVPFAERRPARGISRILWTQLDGKTSLLEAIRRADAELGKKTDDEAIKRLMDTLEYVAKYGYATIQRN
ncbi:MAG: hypothetical protein IJS08_19655 [Victivallales bacterium]|nr:hypothetical protein [Victivallales bacterium]